GDRIVRCSFPTRRSSDLDEFRGNRQIEARVWHNWGKLDLDQALAAAAALESAAQRNLAAQSLYAAYDYGGNDTIDRIEEALGIRSEEHTSELQSRENLVC